MSEKRLDGKYLEYEEIVKEMADGNPGAINSLMIVLNQDKSRFMELTRTLDENNIYGADIWKIFSHHCNEDPNIFYEEVVEKDAIEDYKHKNHS